MPDWECRDPRPELAQAVSETPIHPTLTLNVTMQPRICRVAEVLFLSPRPNLHLAELWLREVLRAGLMYRLQEREETNVTALYTFDVFSTLDGYGSYGPDGDWGGYWGKQGPEFLDRRLALYRERQRLVVGANTIRMFMQSIGPRTGFLKDVDPVNSAMRDLPTTVVSTTLEGPLDWPDATLVPGDAVDVVARLKEESGLPLRSHGSLSMNRALMAAGLVDRLQVTIFPVVSGQTGARPVFGGAADFDLELIESRTLDGRTQELTYRPKLHR